MRARMIGDYSRFPESIRDAMPYVEGEVTELRNLWGLFHSLFMDDRERLQLLGEYLGPFLAVFQQLLENQLILVIARLTDRDSKSQKNYSLFALKPAITSAKDASFGTKVETALRKIEADAGSVRKHRHKHIAHSSADGIDLSKLPPITPNNLKSILEQMEAFMNLFHGEFANSFVSYEELDVDPLLGRAQLTVKKALAYDILEKQGRIRWDELERIIESQKDK